MTLPEFLADLRKREVRLWADGDRLRCRGPVGMLTPELRQALQERKREILAFLRSGAALAEQQRALVPLQPDGTRIPVFAVAGHNGDVFCYRALVQHLGDDQPFFGLEPPGLDGQSEPLARVEDLAGYFADQIRAFRPTPGPYIIVGFCAGGSVAFELARQLVQGGAVVNLVGLFGSPFPAWYRFLPQQRWQLAQQAERVGRHVRALLSLPFRDIPRYVAERLQQRRANREVTAEPVDPVLALRARVERITLAALRRYTPGRFAGRVGLFLPSRVWGRSGAVALGWRTVAPRLEEFVGPAGCDGDTMLREYAARFAELFRRCRDGHDAGPASTATVLPRPLLTASLTH